MGEQNVFPKKIKNIALFILIGEIVFLAYGLLLGFFLGISMVDTASATRGYFFSQFTFLSSPFLILFTFFLLKEKRWAWSGLIFSIPVLLFFLLLLGKGMTNWKIFSLNERDLPLSILFFSHILFLSLFLFYKKYYCQFVAQNDCKKEVLVSLTAALIGMLIFFIGIILLVGMVIIGMEMTSNFIEFSLVLSIVIAPLFFLESLVFGILGLNSTKKKLAKIGIGISLIFVIFFIGLIILS